MPPKKTPDWHYETAIAQVEDIIEQIETGDLDLAAVFSQFAIAVEQLNQCDAFLAQQQAQMSLLIETLTDDRAGDEEDEDF
ncbi:exodeoxyribonuclease VII small subunit [Thermoleptolyngbya oregonensis NK1-22]|jgi:exodeoxyribonuclease VII small subunit|nr:MULTISPECIES: exodeoxyribonuclease VII small subunit [Thermoleptolyngbya]MDG2616455.1 exodeoxyribonuclease VII small subunit [Thermoleptolyngbya sichuanensis XZ-Cy5]WOB42794.1 exodeoxyribonuclease VII small subunit [Thermoleptolyngbya oregonensis NK1-22]HIK39516.1 exodeoxyribonuclease VII small subunit [Thermoleptolyngbya sp. M55_K2018_002]